MHSDKLKVRREWYTGEDSGVCLLPSTICRFTVQSVWLLNLILYFPVSVFLSCSITTLTVLFFVLWRSLNLPSFSHWSIILISMVWSWAVTTVMFPRVPFVLGCLHLKSTHPPTHPCSPDVGSQPADQTKTFSHRIRHRNKL